MHVHEQIEQPGQAEGEAEERSDMAPIGPLAEVI